MKAPRMHKSTPVRTAIESVPSRPPAAGPAEVDTDRWSHQRQAVAAIERELRDGGRALAVSACGSGKSRIAARAAGVLAPVGPVLVTVPTLELVGQLMATFAAEEHTQVGRVVAVCSDKEVMAARNLGLEAEGTWVTTSAAHLARLCADAGQVTVPCTYLSLPVLVAAHAHHGLAPWELAVIDEAHRTAGVFGRRSSMIHDDGLIPARRRLYMTATPKIFSCSPNSSVGGAQDGDDLPVSSMDDEKIFGRRVFEFTTAQGIERGLLADYEVLVVVVTDAEIRKQAGEDGQDVRIGDEKVSARTLATQVAVLRAAAEHGIRRAITYHNRVADARTWSVVLPEVARQLPAGQRPDTVTADYVYGGQRADERRRVLQLLRADTTPAAGPETVDGPDGADGLRVVCNAKVLTEGVDAPAVDAVVIEGARESEIDNVQIVGRALRTGGRTDKIAKIIIPVLIGPDEDPESALQGSAYACVWQVIRALRAHDGRLATKLDTTRRRLGETGEPDRPDPEQAGIPATEPPQDGPGESLADDGHAWLSVAGTHLPERFAQAIHLRAVQVAAPMWMEFYGAALAYRQHHGHIQVPYSHRTESGLALGRWLSQQFGRRWPELTDEQRRLLTELGPYHNVFELNWRKGMAAVHAWIADHPGGLHRIPEDWTHDGVVLWNFMVDRRMDRRAGRLSPERDAELCAADPTWYLTRPQMYIRACRAFYREHGHLLPDPSYRTSGGLDLYAWLHDVRNRYSAGKVTDEVYNALRKLGMIWSRRDAQLMRGIIAARAHHRAHGTLTVPADHICGDGYELGKFLKQQMTSRRDGTIRPWCDQALTAIDPGWYTIRTKAERRARRLALAAAYAEQHGHLPISRAGCPPPEGEDFRSWLADQRLFNRKGTINRDVADGLTAIDPNWCPNPNDPHPPRCPNQNGNPA